MMLQAVLLRKRTVRIISVRVCYTQGPSGVSFFLFFFSVFFSHFLDLTPYDSYHSCLGAARGHPVFPPCGSCLWSVYRELGSALSQHSFSTPSLPPSLVQLSPTLIGCPLLTRLRFPRRRKKTRCKEVLVFSRDLNQRPSVNWEAGFAS